MIAWLIIGQVAWAALPDGSFIGRIYYETVTDLSALYSYPIDLHEYNNRAEKYVLAGMNNETMERLTAAGWRVVPDKRTTDSYNAITRSAATKTEQNDTFYGGYRTVSTTLGIMNDTAAAYPTITELIDYGDSYCKLNVGSCIANNETMDGFDLLAIRVGSKENLASPTGSLSRPALILIAQVHAREITTSEQALFLLDHLTSNYGTDPDITWLVDWRDIYIIPMVNPDGHYIVETVSAPNFQRKNARLTQSNCTGYNWWGVSERQRGVDLNRNHSWEWAMMGTDNVLVGSSDSPCNELYHGSSPASEPETAALETFIRSITEDQREAGPGEAAPITTQDVFITMHSYSDLILYPWGSTENRAPNEAGLKRIADKLGAMTGYEPRQGIYLYPVTGTTDDWVYGEFGIPSFTYEVGGAEDTHHPPYTVASTDHWNEVRDSLLYAAKIANAPYALSHGPEVSSLNAAIVDDMVRITAVVDDSANGDDGIRAFGYTLDTPYRENGDIPTLVLPNAGPLAQTEEGVFIVELDLCNDVGVGEHVVYGAGYDAAQNWGVMQAASFIVPFEACFTRLYIPAVMSAPATPVVVASSSSIVLSVVSLIAFALYWRKE